MKKERLCLCVALQRYVDFPPLSKKIRAVAAEIAKSRNLSVEVISVEAPVALAPSAETLEQKTAAYTEGLASQGVEVQVTVLKGRPSTVLPEYLEKNPAALVVCGAHSRRSPLKLEFGLGNTARALSAIDIDLVVLKGTEDDQDKAEALKIPHYPAIFGYA